MSSNKSFRLSSSPLKVEEEMAPKVVEKQGIVSILGSDSQGPKPAASFRRTLSADMSSKKWLAQNGFKSPTMKKIASSEQLSIINSSFSSSDEEVEEEYDGKKLDQFQKQDDMWSLIISQTKKTEELPPPYVHPLVKKSDSALSEKSLEICTESLGSETGSDGFLSNPSSETGSEADEEESQQQEREYLQSSFDTEELPVVAKYNYSAAASKKMQPRSFPPPLPSLARSSEGPSLHMHSRRLNGRLVLEAVSVPSAKNFHAQRQDGRLRLTLLNTAKDQEKVEQLAEEVEDFEEMFEIFQEEENEVEKDDEEEEMDEEVEKEIKGPEDLAIVMEQAVPKMTSGLINVHRSALVMKKLLGIENQNPKSSHKFNYTPAKLVEVDAEEDEEETTQLPQSLPPRPLVARLIPGAPATSFNAYEYFWRAKPAAASLKNQLTHHYSPVKNNTTNKVVAFNKPKAYEQQELVVLRNCKEARRSLLSWEPYCMTTSRITRSFLINMCPKTVNPTPLL